MSVPISLTIPSPHMPNVSQKQMLKKEYNISNCKKNTVYVGKNYKESVYSIVTQLSLLL